MRHNDERDETTDDDENQSLNKESSVATIQPKCKFISDYSKVVGENILININSTVIVIYTNSLFACAQVGAKLSLRRTEGTARPG